MEFLAHSRGSVKYSIRIAFDSGFHRCCRIQAQHSLDNVFSRSSHTVKIFFLIMLHIIVNGIIHGCVKAIK